MAASTTTNYAFLAPPARPEDLGVLGAYRVISELGRGGMGFVFRAEDTRLKRAVALKVMNEKIAATPYSRRRFIEEARSMAAVKHDNVVTIYEVNEISGTPFMAMEMLKGGTLEAVTKQHQKLEYKKVIDYATQMARGLNAAHSQGIVHRDIKPANIWIEAESDRVKILDFGLALAQVPVDRLAGRGTVVGTPQYLSPEQARSEPLDNRTDLYSLGVVLYEMCTGKLPFRARNVPEQLILTLIHEATPVHEVNKEIPEPLSRLISRLMEKEPRMRPRSALELEKLLGEVAVECEAKSDVAQAISLLQSQLNLVKEKQPDPFTACVTPSAPRLNENLFSELPSVVVTAALPAATPVASVPKASPTIARSAPGRPTPSRPKPTQDSAPKFALPSYWPWIAAGIGGLAFLGIVQYVFISSAGNPHQSSVVISPQADGNNTGNSGGGDSSKATPGITNEPAPQPTAITSNGGSGNGDGSGKKGQGKKGKNGQGQNRGQDDLSNSAKESIASRDVGNSVSGNDNPAMIPSADPAMVTPNMTTSASMETSPSNAMPADPTSVPAESTTAKPAVQEHIAIRSGEGRSADTTVKRGASSREQLGNAISIAVQTRGALDVQHSYIRFDLKESHKRLNDAADVSLVLTIPGEGGPEGATVRVYGIPEQYPDNWQEIGPRSMNWDNSISGAGLDSIPLLAEVTLTGNEGSSLRITDPRMTEFIRGVGEEFVSFVLAGGSPGNKPLHFVSRDGSSEQAPMLEFDVLESDRKKR